MVKATVQSAKNREAVYLVGESPMGELATPINSSGIVVGFINNLPAYRKGLTPFRRGLEVGMAHGYWLLGPFVELGPLRDTPIAAGIGLASTIALVAIATLALALYSASAPPAGTATVTTPVVPDAFQSGSGWNSFSTGFLVGGVGGALVAYLVLLGLSIFS